MRIGLIASAGGHLAHLWRLRGAFEGFDRFWVTFDLPDARERLRGERVYFAHHPTQRSLARLIANGELASRILRQEQPNVLLSSGAAVAIPFFALAPRRTRRVFLEVVDRVDRASLTGQLLAPWCDEVWLPLPEQVARYDWARRWGKTRLVVVGSPR